MTAARFQRIRGEGRPNREQDAIGQVLDPLAEAVGNTPIMGASPPPWIRPALAGGFADVGAPFALTAYHKDALGYVHGKFTLVTAAGAVANTTAFMLDKSHCPLETLLGLASDGAGLTWEFTINSVGAFVIITATAAGDVVAGTFSFLAGA